MEQWREAEAMPAEAERSREVADVRGQVTSWLQNAMGLPTLFDVASDATLGALAADANEFLDSAGELLEASTHVLLYEGNHDAKDGMPTAEAWIRELNWDGLAAFQDTAQAVWRQGNGGAGQGQKLAGYRHDSLKE
ncbi:Serine carboxypeptidase-like 50 [Zea mays]|uniref:Serine carboxypeptidase-like 50 n=1 Tax=Zea mays TaxID=4577 RepID=A0A1D6LWI2_MAIZE|nr:Serine carboxypeptidase-like 50 [Zea mays]